MIDIFKENKRIILLPIIVFLVGVVMYISSLYGNVHWEMLGMTYLFLLTPVIIVWGVLLEWVNNGFIKE